MQPKPPTQAPQPPEKPLPTDCCDGGCDPCVMDVYLDELAAYQKALERWQQQQAKAGPSGQESS